MIVNRDIFWLIYKKIRKEIFFSEKDTKEENTEGNSCKCLHCGKKHWGFLPFCSK
jgi:hypothetical protein